MEITINENNLQYNEIQEFKSKVRAILINEKNEILIAKYFNLILLPGGKVDKEETLYTAIIRELNEELGVNYNINDLKPFITINYYQKNYPKADGILTNRLVQTHYYIGKYIDIKKNSQKLSEKEQKGNFKLELVSIENLNNIIKKIRKITQEIYIIKKN